MIVNGEGPTTCRAAFIGEAPGATEERFSRPFVGCYDTSTQVLAARGWLRFEQIQQDDLIYSLNLETELIELSKIVRIIKYDYTGLMYRVKTNQVDLLVTPDHKMVVRPYSKLYGKYSPLQLISANKIFGKHVHYKKDGIWLGISTLELSIDNQAFNAENFLLLAGFYIAEGYVRHKPRKKCEEDIFMLSVTKDRTFSLVESVLKSMDLDYTKDERTITIRNKPLRDYFAKLGYCYEKYIPKELLQLEPKLLKFLLAGLIEGDGSGNRWYFTSSPKLKDDFQELALKLGMSAYFYTRGFRNSSINGRPVYQKVVNYELTLNKDQNSPRVYRTRALREKNKVFEEDWIDYSGQVWCLELEKNHTMYVRRNGKPIWSGNSAGLLLERKLHNAGFIRRDCYITNVSKIRPITFYNMDSKGLKTPKEPNDFSIFWNGRKPTSILISMKNALLKELDSLETNLFIPLGANALWALTGLYEIGKYRGSILSCQLPSGRKVKVIPTYHPAAVMKQRELEPHFDCDLARCADDSRFPELNLPERRLIIMPSSQDVKGWCLDESAGKSDICFDIETSNYTITCVSLAYQPHTSMSIPLTKEYWGSIYKLREVLLAISTALKTPHLTKVAQNISFDLQYLIRLAGILPTKPWYDTMLASHACYPELPKGLDFLTSIWTREQYYKDDLKTWDANKTDLEKLWNYNALDSAVTIEVKQALEPEIDELGVRWVYNMMMDLVEPFICMQLHGMRVDQKKVAEYVEKIEKMAKLALEGMNKQLGINIMSSKQLSDYAYNKLGMKPVINRKTGNPTVGKNALEKLAKQHPVFKEIEEVKKANKLADFLKMPTDPITHKWHCSFNITGAVTGRPSSSEGVFGSGGNMQNIPIKLRDMVIPSEGMVLTNADLKGADAIVMAYLIDDPIQIKIFQSGNIHKWTAKMIWGMEDEAIDADKEKCKAEGRDNESKYFIAKKVRHSGNYNAGWRSFQESINSTPDEAKRLLNKFHEITPNLRRYHQALMNKLRLDRTIITPMGRKRVFYGYLNDDMLREALAFVPQSTVADVIDTGITKIYNELAKFHPVHLLDQVHDSLLLEHPAELTEYVHLRLLELMRVDLLVNGYIFYIPISINTGKDWKEVSG